MTVKTRIYKREHGEWVEVFAHDNTEGTARAFCQATGCGVTPFDLTGDLEAGTAFEATDPDGVLGLVCRDDSPHSPRAGGAK